MEQRPSEPSSLDDLQSGPNLGETRGRILAADDDNVSLELLKELLSMSGYHVQCASDGLQAIDLFQQNRPDIVITDIRMPHKDGLEVLSRLRELDDTVPVILVTGYGDLDNALGALRRGAYDFLLKPIKPDRLINTVNKGIELSRLKRLERDYRKILERQVEERTRELASTNEFLSGILNSSRGVSIILTDFNGVIQFWNTGAENIYGYKADEIVGSNILKLSPDRKNGEQELQTAKRLIENEKTTIQQNIKRISKDGRELTVFSTMSPMLDSSGKMSGILSLGQDVTEQVRLHDDLRQSYDKIRRLQGAFIFALANLAESRDEETALHLKRIQAYCKLICERLRASGLYTEKLTDDFIENLMQGSILHDIGKVGLPDKILFTTDKFTDIEFEIMKQHTIKGGLALEQAAREAGEDKGYLTLGKEVAFYHHEHWDGTGYPFGLMGNVMPLYARIVALADVYDALTTERRYKEAFDHENARRTIVQGRGKQFDPTIVDAFLGVEQEFKQIRDDFMQSISENKDSLIRGRSDTVSLPSNMLNEDRS
ncbi:MAG: hypothetical protein QG577_1855 [Thermodesulfobacteriota bacterium]|nr:hypothetical protein [Thermodesulfobacteriota bacterium]